MDLNGSCAKWTKVPPPNSEESAPLSPSPTHQLADYLETEKDPTIEALEKMIDAINQDNDASTLSANINELKQQAEIDHNTHNNKTGS